MGSRVELSEKVKNEIRKILEDDEKKFTSEQVRYTRRGMGLLATGFALSSIALLWSKIEDNEPSIKDVVDKYYSSLQIDNTAIKFLKGVVTVDPQVSCGYIPRITTNTNEVPLIKPSHLHNPLLFIYKGNIFFTVRSPAESRLLFYPYVSTTQEHFSLTSGETIGTQPVQNGRIKKVTSLTDRVGPLFFAQTNDMKVAIPVGRAY